ncbi:tRNA pseudouridine(55) synthase TruB [Butyrivibrio sp. INlla14]|uniref:tRNA pseudouridine(55) synthase TruB n=1 Tax=Butyrivibrio sp. INlla14 TaxID=1520808 RepID=UPI0008775146|nr:tRNA pseudouridine(55) synthase TruB [Butyrivibrio sp. INlla14]SCY51916.1 tRNA pseudouridine55 synthase [Butyrivibrio sp. INlla14]
MNKYNGLINIYKEQGFTSNDVVAKLRGILHQKKIGHTGTLDPDATGVLVVCLGTGTKLVETLTDHDKEYIAVCKLGVTTDTQDMSGTVLTESEVHVTRQELHEAVQAFVGDYDQIPPMYSAIKQNGKKLYELAREGIEVERKPRKIHIGAITILDDSNLEKDSSFVMEIKCSKGTYIRTLCNDIGERLGCGAAMQNLMRTRVGAFALDSAVKLSQVEEMRDNGTLESIIKSPEYIFRDLDAIHVSDNCRVILENGNSFRKDNLVSEDPEGVNDKDFAKEMFSDGDMFRVYSEDDTFFGIYKYDARTKQFKVDKFFFEKN